MHNKKENKAAAERETLADAQLALSMLELEYLEERRSQLSDQNDYDVLHGKVTCEHESLTLHYQLRMLNEYIDALKGRIIIEKARMVDRNKPVIMVNEQLLETDLVKKMTKAWKRLAEVNDYTPHHCGQDTHDPCGEQGPEGDLRPVEDGSEDAGENHATLVNLKSLIGMCVIDVDQYHYPCSSCPNGNYNTHCVKVELVGGHYLCLAPQPDSIITE